MKTLNITPAQQTLSMDEIIFEGRNKAYGAYNLRAKYNKHIIWVFLIAFSIIFSTVATAYITVNKKPAVILLPSNGPIVLNLPPAPPIAPPPPPPSNALVHVAVWRIPEVVDTVINPEIYLLAEETPVTVKYNEHSDGPIETITPEMPIDEPPTSFPDIPASYQGRDIEYFRTWVISNIKYPETATDLNLSGKVTIQFVVNKVGKVENIKVLRGVDKLLDDEAIRVINSSLDWTPGLIKGKKIRQVFTIPIMFKVQ